VGSTQGRYSLRGGNQFTLQEKIVLGLGNLDKEQ